MIRYLLAKWFFGERYMRAFFALQHEAAKRALEDSGKWFVAHKSEPMPGRTFFGVMYAARAVAVIVDNPGESSQEFYALPGDCVTLLGQSGADKYRWTVRMQAERLQ